MSETVRSLPESRAAEAAVVGSMMQDDRALAQVVAVLKESDFHHEELRRIYQVICQMYEAGAPIDGLTVREKLDQLNRLEEIGGAEFVRQVIESVPSARSAMYYAGIVRETALRRTLVFTGQEIADSAFDESRDIRESLAAAEGKLFAALERREQQEGQGIAGLMTEAFNDIEKRKGNALTGLSTGFYELDDLTGGLQKGEMTIIAGRPSMGKTALALNIADYAARVGGANVQVFSMEMGCKALSERVLCSEANLDSREVRRGALTAEQWQSLVVAVEQFQTVSLVIDDTPYLTPFELRARARHYQFKYKTDLIMLDYLQLMGSGKKAENRQQEITLISRHLKAMARELNVPVVVVSQLNRGPEAREGHRPRLSDLRESGSIEQDADLVLLLHRPDYYEQGRENYIPTGTAEVILAKQRNGPTGVVNLVFRESRTRFENLAKIDQDATPF